MTECTQCGHELELLSLKKVGMGAKNDNPALVLVLSENHRYASWECPQCEILYLIRERSKS